MKYVEIFALVAGGMLLGLAVAWRSLARAWKAREDVRKVEEESAERELHLFKRFQEGYDPWEKLRRTNPYESN